VSTLTKVFVVLTSVLSIALSCLFIAAAAQWDNWRGLARDYQSGRDAAITQAQSVAASAQTSLAMKDETLANTNRDLSAARDEIKRFRDENAKLLGDLSRSENGRLAAEAGRTKLQEMLDVEAGERKSLQKQNQDLLTQGIDLQSRNARQNSRILELTTNVTILQDQIRNIQEKLYASEQRVAQLEKQGGAPSAKAPAESPTGIVAVSPMTTGQIQGEVVEVDGVYATVNIGESEGVVPGMIFMVYRVGAEKQYLADLVIERVLPKQAGGRLTTAVQGGIQKGDAVVYGSN
jgi:hypothetical protein